jgi:hypothetical protein
MQQSSIHFLPLLHVLLSAVVWLPPVRATRLPEAIASTSSSSAPTTTQLRVTLSPPTLVAATQTEILWYPLNGHKLQPKENGGPAAMLIRAQTSGDVNTGTTDAAFVSYTDGSSWAAAGPQPAQLRTCYPYPPTDPSTALCLPTINADTTHGDQSSAFTATFPGTVWALVNGSVFRRPGLVNATFDYSAAPAAARGPPGTSLALMTDGVSAAAAASAPGGAAGELLLPLMATAQPLPPAGLTAECRAKTMDLCPGVDSRGW